jgi:hypothetical protein
MELKERQNVYNQATNDINEKEFNKMRVKGKQRVCRDEYKLIKLTKEIPNWQEHLTDNQTKVVKMYLSCKNTTSIDHIRGTANGTTHSILFGSRKGKKVRGGALKKLQKIYNFLKDFQMI